uniref:PNPLA domain-containing protein n=1 Tax=Oryza punctata TaxID=4537 RepID=A0A0E0MJN9_ORYPU
MWSPADEAAFREEGYTDFAKGIEKFYVAASERLPLEEIPDLVGCIDAGGLCFGLADPVTNIILNAIALLPPPTSSYQPKSKSWWHSIATKSHDGLCVFMTSYFSCLSKTQALRYLYLACQDLPLAIDLVLYDPLKAKHPDPDVLAALMTAQYPTHLLSAVLAKVQNKNVMLSSIDVWEIKDLLARQWPPYPRPTNIGFRIRPDGVNCTRLLDGGLLITDCLDDGIVANILILRAQPLDHELQYLSQLTLEVEAIDERLSSCLVGPVIGRLEKEQDSETEVDHDNKHHLCERILPLRMCLLRTIHDLALAPLASGALLTAGYCYGPMDPVSNIIFNTVWYDIAFGVDVGSPEGIFCTKPLSRMVSRSLDALVAISSLSTGKSEHEALHHISTLGCDLSAYLFHAVDGDGGESPSSTQETACIDTMLFAAAKASKHPQHEAFASSVTSLPFTELFSLRDLLLSKPGTKILSPNWDKFDGVLRGAMPVVSTRRSDMDARHNMFSLFRPSPSLMMFPSASPTMSREKQGFVCTELNKLLREYCYQHPWEPSYKLDVICGVMESSRSSFYSGSTLYHANFLASNVDYTCTSSQTKSTLFFVEFWEASFTKAVESKPSSCKRIKNHSHTGRCSICENEVSMIIHPPSGGHSGDITDSIDIYYTSPAHRDYPQSMPNHIYFNDDDEEYFFTVNNFVRTGSV